MAAVTPGAEFTLTPRQRLARKTMGGPATHFMAFGGSRSGKTFMIIRAIIIRALRASGSSHVILRHRLNHLKGSIIGQTVPAVIRLCFPHLWESWVSDYNKSDFIWELPNGSRLVFGGLDDALRTEKILGQEHVTIYLNECSQISYGSRNKALTRLAQAVLIDGTDQLLRPRMFYDCNPPPMGHWTHLMFVKKQEPLSRTAQPDPDDYDAIQMNPKDNLQNLGPGYMKTLDSLPERDRRRFRDGEFLAQVDNALWDFTTIEKRRVDPRKFDGLGRTVIGLDPSGTKGDEDLRSDEVGIVAAGRDFGGRGIVLEDATCRKGPEGWARQALQLYDKWQADAIVAEINYGGAMVESVIRAQRSSANVIVVTASRGKHIRAEPVATLTTKGDWLFAGVFPELEDELVYFSTAGYQGARSPNRADAMIWAATELMLGESYNLENVA